MAKLYKHIFISGNVTTEKYKTKGIPIIPKPLPIRDRAAHSANLLQKFEVIWAERDSINQERDAKQIQTREGTYLSFSSQANNELITESLEALGQGIRLLNVKEIPINNTETQIRATIYIPKGKEAYFIGKINKYQTKNSTVVWFPNQHNHDAVEAFVNQLGEGISLSNIKNIEKGTTLQTRAKVSLPVGMEEYFVEEISKFESSATISITYPNSPLVNSIEDVSLALLESFWTDNIQLIPKENAKWCEVWLNVNTKENKEQEQIAIFKSTLERIGIEYKPSSIIFPERAVLLINPKRNQLVELMLQSDLLAEFRAGQELAGFWTNERAAEQQTWIEDLLQRLEIVDSSVKVCVLDTGVNNGHQLLQPLLDNDNTLTVEPAWGTHDHATGSGHGTLMAGVVAYGKLEDALSTTGSFILTHQLCSVKILPPPNREATPEELWGAKTSEGISRAEIQNPEMILIYCMAVTSAVGVNKGRPSSWSGAVDNLAFGDGDNQRLILISAGNIRDNNLWIDYPRSNFKASIENPAQSWNALTVGAFTEKTTTNDPNYVGYIPVANEGELSPYSTTSLDWEKKWPIKPEIVFEGGNLLKAPDNSVTQHEDLDLLSTSKQIQIKQFDTINATSAATAQASWFAAKIAYEYPNAWAETIRGLMIHSADWNEAMKQQLNVIDKNRADYNRLLKVFGYGNPDINKALYSKESAFTFVSQESIQPFGYNDKRTPETNEIQLFNLPWPADLLLSMSEIPVKLKITLSYFIQPGAGEIGWKDKYRYQSYGLRFDINKVGEDEDSFRKRVNVAAREEDEHVDGNGGSDRWTIGVNNRSNGSIHSDYWEGTAADLATCHFIAVYPVIGWWRERKHLGQVENKTRYSLIISLETPAQDIELYTTVKNIIEIPIEIQTS